MASPEQAADTESLLQFRGQRRQTGLCCLSRLPLTPGQSQAGTRPGGDTVGASFARFLMAVAYLPLADRVALVGMKVG